MLVLNMGSGSKGNATLIKSSNTTILIDAGLSYKQMKLRSEGLIEKTDYILVTHEHSDHIGGLSVLLNNIECPILLSEKCFNAINSSLKAKMKDFRFVKPFTTYNIGNMQITPVQLYHDSVDCLGYVIIADDEKIVYITDTGYVHKDNYPFIKNANLYFLESNHDVEMLLNSDRTYDLKLRIFGDGGHLANEDASSLICYVLGDKTKKIIFGHLSEECNTEEKVLKAAEEVFLSFGLDIGRFDVFCANQNRRLIVEVKE